MSGISFWWFGFTSIIVFSVPGTKLFGTPLHVVGVPPNALVLFAAYI